MIKTHKLNLAIGLLTSVTFSVNPIDSTDIDYSGLPELYSEYVEISEDFDLSKATLFNIPDYNNNLSLDLIIVKKIQKALNQWMKADEKDRIRHEQIILDLIIAEKIQKALNQWMKADKKDKIRYEQIINDLYGISIKETDDLDLSDTHFSLQ